MATPLSTKVRAPPFTTPSGRSSIDRPASCRDCFAATVNDLKWGMLWNVARLGNTDLTISIIGLGCYGMSGAYGPADDAESIATSRRALDLGDQLSRPISQLRQGHNHRLIREASRGRMPELRLTNRCGLSIRAVRERAH